MPFKSEAQHRKFRVLLREGKISKADFDKWMDETREKHGKKHPIKPLPERIHKKEAFMKGFGEAAKNFAKSNPEAVGGLGGVALGGGLGYALSSEKALRKDPMWMNAVKEKARKKKIPIEKNNPKWKKFVSEQAKETRLLAMGINAAALGTLGAMLGDDYRQTQRAREYWERSYRAGQGHRTYSYSSGLDDALSKLNINKSQVKTKAQAKKMHRDAARKHHPDLGGDPEKMKEINEAWDIVQNSSWFDKLAFLRRLYGASHFL